MERKNNNNNSSISFICKKIREALANCPALVSIINTYTPISQNHQQEYSKTMPIASKSPNTKTVMQTKPTKPQHLKVHSEEAESIPIKFDYSTPIIIPNIADHHQNGKAKAEKTEQNGKKDTNDTFTEFIERERQKRRAKDGGDDDAKNSKYNINNGYGTTKKENHKDYFGNFIHVARKNIRTTSIIRKEY